MGRFDRAGRTFRRRQLRLESLESRQLMAGDLQLALVNQDDAPAAPLFHLGHDHGDFGVFPGIPADGTTTTTSTYSGSKLPLSSIPVLNSFPGAPVTVYLDFDGHFESVWGSERNVTTPVFDQDGDPTTFSEGELNTIRQVWAQVAEDFIPFNINVTTVEPASFANGVGLRASIGGDGAFLGGGMGGVAYLDSFTNSIVNTVYVFPKNLANGYAKYVAEAVSHEVGHAFGLDHQSVFSSTGTKLNEYNSGTSALAPIMGSAYSATRSVWWAGQNSLNKYQDDLAVLTRSINVFGYRADDHGNSISTATTLDVSGAALSGSGIIHHMSDVDYFSFTTGAGPVTVAVAVPVGINNLDARLELRNSSGTIIASAAPSTSFGATITTTLPAGNYFVVVASQGNYGDLGQYTVSGTIVAPAEPDAEPQQLTAPGSLTAARGTSSVALNWSDTNSQETGYVVERRIDGGAWGRLATLAANATSYTDNAVSAGGSYDYRVQAVASGQTSEWSEVASVVFAPAAPGNLTASASSSTRVNLAWSDVAGETGYVVERSSNGGTSWVVLGTVGANVTAAADTSVVAAVTYQYRIRAINAGGESAYSNIASVKTPGSVTRPAAPSGLMAVPLSTSQVRLSWNDNSDNETRFYVERSLNGSSWSTIGYVGADTTAAINSSLSRGKTYYYRVRAYNSAGYSAYSNVAKVTTFSNNRPLEYAAAAPTSSKTTLHAEPTTAAKPQAHPSRDALVAVYTLLAQQPNRPAVSQAPERIDSLLQDRPAGTSQAAAVDALFASEASLF